MTQKVHNCPAATFVKEKEKWVFALERVSSTGTRSEFGFSSNLCTSRFSGWPSGSNPPRRSRRVESLLSAPCSSPPPPLGSVCTPSSRPESGCSERPRWPEPPCTQGQSRGQMWVELTNICPKVPNPPGGTANSDYVRTLQLEDQHFHLRLKPWWKQTAMDHRNLLVPSLYFRDVCWN